MKKIFRILLVTIIFVNLKVYSNKTKTDVTIERIALAKWKEMKFGMFIHWGIYSIPAGIWKGKEIPKLGEQIQRHANIPYKEYAKLAKDFNPVKFNSDSVVLMAKNAGMKYIVLTAKHHDGFCMFKSKYTKFNIVDATPYKKDILKQLANSCRKYGMKLGVYYSNPDWHFNGPSYDLNSIDHNYSVFDKISKGNEDYEVNQLTEILSNYGAIVELFFDMGNPTPEQSERFAKTVHSLQPKCMINGRVMNNQGDFITMPDNHLPDLPVDSMAWEVPCTFYHTWGYKSWIEREPLKEQIKTQVRNLATIVSRGGNFLLNIGPKSDGTVIKYEQDAIKGIGEWMQIHREAIVSTEYNPFKRLNFGECTRKGNNLYFFIMNWPKSNKLVIPGLMSSVISINTLDEPNKKLNYKRVDKDIVIELNDVKVDKNLTVIKLNYKSKLNIIDPIVVPNAINELKLEGNMAIRQGKYGKESYSSILKNYSNEWDIRVPKSGKYNVEICYNMKYDNKDFKIKVDDQILNFKLLGDRKIKEHLTMNDGNETKQSKQVKYLSKSQHTLVVGSIELKKSKRTKLVLAQGHDFIFTNDIEKFNSQDPKYRSMNISLKYIRLFPVK